jgi:hypothetical protein
MRCTLLIPLLAAISLVHAEDKPDLPIVDLSDQKDRHTVIAAGTEQTYQGHPTTTLLCRWQNALLRVVHQSRRRCGTDGAQR